MSATRETETALALRRLAGGGLIAGAVGFAVAGALHPGSSADSLREATIEILAASTWPVAHWAALVTTLLLALAVWLLVDAGVTGRSAVAHAGARLTILGGLFMAVQSAAEVAAPSARPALVAGQEAPLVSLIEAMQTVGWPALSLGLAALALGCGRALAPAAVVWLAAAGATAMAAGGILVEGFGVVAFGVLFQFGGFLALWLLWAGVRLVRGSDARAAARVTEPASA